MSKKESIEQNSPHLGETKLQNKTASIARWFLLTIILIFTCGGLIWYGQQIVNSINTSFDQNNKKIEAMSQALNINKDDLATVTVIQENMEEIFKAQNFNLEQLRNRDSEQQQDLNRLQNQINEISNMSSEGNDYWMNHQTEYFLNIAKIELSLYGNQASAKSALIAAQQSIIQLPDEYQIVDQSIQLAVSKLDPDNYKMKRNEILINLQNIKNSVDSLILNPMNTQLLVKKESEQQTVKSVLEIAWRKITTLFTNLVVVKTNSDIHNAKLNTTQKQLTKALINLQLEMTRFAVFQNDDDEYQASLKNSIQLLEKSFSTDMSDVKELINQLNDLKDFKLKQSVQEIDDSLTLLNEINTS